MSNKNYLRLKKDFIKYNTLFSSNVSVERLFSYGDSILMSQRDHLNDDTMEQHLLLTVNKNIK